MNLRTSVLARLITMGVLLLGLLVPLSMIESVVSDRATRRQSVTEEIGASWGGPQRISGPVLVVPYRYVVNDPGTRRELVGRASFLPESFDAQGVLEPETRRRTLFTATVYRAHVKISGHFSRPDFSKVTSMAVTPLWNEATVGIGIADPRGISKRVALTMNGRDAPFVPGGGDPCLCTIGLRASTPLGDALPDGATLPFAFELDVNGTRDFRMLPSGSDTSVQITSTWPHPSFVGAPAPAHTTSGAGFTATWRVPYFGRGFAPAWTDVGMDCDKLKAQADAAAFGVSLIQPVDIYQQSERAIKYASLFIVLTFALFFLCEIIRSRLLHPIQYLFVGFAMSVFYLLLVSISEHLGFDVAYACASVSTVSLIALYSGYALGGARDGALLGVALSALYGFLYLLLRLEDYALLAGSLGLFLMLALVMLATRRVNWYELRIGDDASRSGGSSLKA
jgi:inner membrane protein